jgi:peptide/nickel transport system ATP-binding protein
MSNPLLEVADLRITFDSETKSAVAGLNLKVEAGSRVGIIGESGSGKSITGMSILRLNDEKAMKYGEGSRILFEGKDLLKSSPMEINSIRGSSISMIFQDPMATLNPVFKVGRQISDVLRTHRPQSRNLAKQQVLKSLESVGIRDVATVYGKYPHELSGGMRQRVMIAMAISGRPRLLIADEPTSALDVTVQAAVLDTLEELTEDLGMAVLFITHDMGVVARFCDEVYVMRSGEVVEYGAIEKILGAPDNPYTQQLLASVPRVHS